MTTDPNDALARVRQEFTRGLPERLQRIRSGLTELIQGFNDRAAEQFHVASHALVGMAATFEAHDMAEQARELATLGRRWRKEGAAPQPELDEAQQGVDRLDGTIHAFLAQAEDSTTSDRQG
ncbi:MAG: Hpt domain-containing protein [Gemmatimonadota bacterium]|nr:Hpt domain-containing protein [Gemmatimonadota bacterium]